jgi:hypothetical protein
MTTTPSPTPRTTEQDTPAVSIGDRVASDLRVIADIAATHPDLAPQLAHTVEQLYVVLRCSSDLSPEDFGDALTSRHAENVPPAIVEPMWSSQAWQLPAGAIRLTVTQLTVAIEELGFEVASELASTGDA